MDDEGHGQKHQEVGQPGQKATEKPLLLQTFSHEEACKGAGQEIDPVDGHGHLTLFQVEFVQRE